jgi:hypothetical protein
VSAHVTRGEKTVARIIGGSTEQARNLLDALGEVGIEDRPPRTLRWARDGDATSVTIAPYRRVIGAAIREEHLEMDMTRYFVTAVDGVIVTPAQAQQWFLRRPTQLGLAIKRALLALKGIKKEAKFDEESLSYFFPFGYGCAELYFERDFDHSFDRATPEQSSRSLWLADLWQLRLLDLGEYKSRYEEDLARDVEAAIRRRQASR